jgi:glycosyltransferase involved in cell wall biosynthesis
MRFITSISDEVIANSNLTSVVNQKLYSTRIDHVVNLGIGYDIYDKLMLVKEVPVNRGNTIVFVGRIVGGKNVDKLLYAIKEFAISTDEDYSL